MKSKNNIKKQYDLIGEDYIKYKSIFFKNRKNNSLKYILKYLPNIKNKTILDFGCGNGYLLKKLNIYNPKKVYGIDTSKLMIDKAKDNLKETGFLSVQNIEKTNFKNNSFDLVISRFSLHYLKTFNKAYIEINRILKKNGCLILVVSHPITDLFFKKNNDYFNQEVINLKLYNNKVNIKYPSHSLDDYLNSIFLDNFKLVNFFESKDIEINSNKYKIPGLIFIKAIKL